MKETFKKGDAFYYEDPAEFGTSWKVTVILDKDENGYKCSTFGVDLQELFLVEGVYYSEYQPIGKKIEDSKFLDYLKEKFELERNSGNFENVLNIADGQLIPLTGLV